MVADYVVAGFLPAFEKIGKTCHIYLTPVHLIILHNVLNSDGVQAIAQFSKVSNLSLME